MGIKKRVRQFPKSCRQKVFYMKRPFYRLIWGFFCKMGYLSANQVTTLQQLIGSIAADLEDWEYSQKVLFELENQFHLDRLHFAGRDGESKAVFYESRGWAGFPESYRKYEEYDPSKPDKMGIPPAALAVHFDGAKIQYLKKTNPLFNYLCDYIRGPILLGVHPEGALCGVRGDAKDFSSGEIAMGNIVMPLAINCYFLHKRIMRLMDREKSFDSATFKAQESQRVDAPFHGGINYITPQETRILYCVKKGYTNKQIATELQISTETVKKHLSNLFAKTGVKNRLQLSLIKFE